MKKLKIGLSLLLGITLLSGCSQEGMTLKMKYDSFSIELGNPILKSAEYYINKKDLTDKEFQTLSQKTEITVDTTKDDLMNNEYEKTGTYHLTLSYDNQEKKADIVVKDTRAPQIKGDDILYVKTNSQVDYSKLYKVVDYNDVESLIVDDSQVLINKQGQYNLNLSVKDKAGNIGEKEVIVKVQDIIKKDEPKDKVLLDVPYYNQLDVDAPNGCETTATYMALKYKNKIDIDITKFIEQQPRAISPYDGFSGDPFSGSSQENEYPTIFPPALAKYSSTYTNCKDISGASIDEIKKELAKENPVIVYVTGGMNKAIGKQFYFGKVTSNIHIMLLNGYDDNTKSFSVLDPIDKDLTSVSYDKFAQAYDLMKFAVTVE
ncbi:MAG: C39 family peptidase [Coprobacillus sp.]